MGKKTPKTPPFLLKLFKICTELPSDIGGWMMSSSTIDVEASTSSHPKSGAAFDRAPNLTRSKDETTKHQFAVFKPDAFFEFIRNYYTGSSKTFFRQLSYFRFSKRELLPKGFAFSHDNFRRNDVQSLSLIKRVLPSMRSDSDEEDDARKDDPASTVSTLDKLESAVKEIRQQVDELTRVVATLVSDIRHDRHEDEDDSRAKRLRMDMSSQQLPYVSEVESSQSLEAVQEFDEFNSARAAYADLSFPSVPASYNLYFLGGNFS